MSDFKLKTLKRTRYWKNLHTKNNILKHFTPKKRQILHFLFFRKAWFWNKKFKTLWVFELKNSRSLAFDVEKNQRIRFWLWKKIRRFVLRKFFTTRQKSIDNLITCQNLNWKIFIFLISISNLSESNVLFTTQRFPLFRHEQLVSINFSSNEKWHSPFKQISWANFHTDFDLYLRCLVLFCFCFNILCAETSCF